MHRMSQILRYAQVRTLLLSSPDDPIACFSGLKQHMHIHKTIKPYTCEVSERNDWWQRDRERVSFVDLFQSLHSIVESLPSQTNPRPRDQVSHVFDHLSQRATLCATSKGLFAVELLQRREQMQSDRCGCHSSLSVPGPSTEQQRRLDLSGDACRGLGSAAQADSLSFLSATTVDGLWHPTGSDPSEEDISDGRRIAQSNWDEQCDVRGRRGTGKAAASRSGHGLLRVWILFETVSSSGESHSTSPKSHGRTTLHVSDVHTLVQYLFELTGESLLTSVERANSKDL